MIDEAKLNAFLGHELGLYKAMAPSPVTPEELAALTGTDARYVREWLGAQAASGYVEHHADSGRYSLSEEQALTLTDEKGPAYLPGAFLLAVSSLRSLPALVEAFRSGKGLGWHDHDEGLFRGTELFFRPG